jgi:hypothetical protein
MNPLPVNALPPFARALIALIGEQATLILAARWPSVRLYVPTVGELENEAKGVHPIVAAIGLFAARKLSEAYGPGIIVVPACHDAIRTLRVADWVRRFYQGESARDIALADGVSERWVQQKLSAAGAKAARRNLSLFED